MRQKRPLLLIPEVLTLQGARKEERMTPGQPLGSTGGPCSNEDYLGLNDMRPDKVLGLFGFTS